MPHQHQHSHEAADHAPAAQDPTDPVQHWEEVYAREDGAPIWSGAENVTMAALVADLEPGTAIDLGCGEGADAIWLARRGWSVTGVDLSPTALARASTAADAAGVSTGTTFVEADLSTWDPAGLIEQIGSVDLVTASFLHSRVDFPREEVLRRAAGAIRPGGHLAILSHAGVPPWADAQAHAHADLPLPAEEFQRLALDPDGWEVLVLDTCERAATGPGGESATLTDGRILVRRR